MAFRVRHPPHSAWKRITKARTGDAGEDALRRLRSFLDAKEPEIVRLLARLWGDQQQAITYQELRTAILNGYIDEQTAQDWMNDYSHFVNEKLRPQWEDAMRAANARLEAEHPGLFFNAHDPGVQEWLSTRGGELITVIGWEQRQAINAMVGRAYAGEWTVDELARAIRPTIGLNRPQAAANLNYYERTKATLLQNNPSMREATAEKRAREAAVKYAEKQHRYRAFMIARTEMAFAYNRGMDEGIKQAIAKGYMGACVRVWVTAADERMCPVCGELEGVEIGMEGQYDFSRVNSRLPSGPTPPAHPNCRCAVDYREIAPPVPPVYLSENSFYDGLTMSANDGILTDEDVYALYQYKSSGVAYPLNEMLREGKALDEKFREIAHNVDMALLKLPKYQGIVYRSLDSKEMDDEAAFWEAHSPGNRVVYSAYTSSSTEIYDESMDIQMVIQSVNGRDMRDINPQEQEILFRRGSMFFVERQEGKRLWLTEIAL